MKKDLLKKISKYTAASAAALASASSADAAVVYGDINPNALIDTNSATAAYFLDLDGDGGDDFVFTKVSWTNGDYGIKAIGSYPAASVGGSNNIIIGSSNYTPSLFGTSQSISSGLGFAADGGSNDQFIASFYSGSVYGAGTSTNSYLGVQFEIAGQNHYGWIRFNSTVDVANSYVSVTLLDYAYEDCPNTAIQVGATVGGGACAAIEDVALVDVHEYTQMPFKQANGMDVDITIDNPGTADVTDAIVNTEIYLAPNFTTPVQSFTSGANSVTAGNSTTITTGTFMPTAEGTYGILHVVSSAAFGVDNDATNDTVAYLMEVGETFARDDNNVGGSIGIGAGAAENGVVGSNYTLRVDGDVDSVNVFINNGAAGNTMVGQPLSLSIYSTTAGTPNAVLHTTNVTTVTQTGPHWETLAISGGPVNLPAGEYFFGVHEADSNVTLGVTSSIFTPGVNWVTWNALGSWSNTEDFGVNFEDAYMVRPHFSTCEPVSFTAPPVVSCDSAVINGSTYFSSQTVIDTLVGASSCGGDSIVTTSLTINNSASSIEDLTACTSATINGNTYTSSQVVVDVFPGGAASGCDSTHTTNLTINMPVTTNRSMTACNTATFNGNTYTSSQIVTDVFPGGAANGCDSTLITDLTISNFAQANYDLEGCSSVIGVDGLTYTTSQVVRDTLIGGSAAGCDSITVQNITVNMPSTSTEDLSACGSATINGNTYTSSQAVVDVFPGGAANGCDSTHTTNLTINNAVTSNEIMEACGSATINGNTYTSSQIVTDVFPGGAANGCDSTHTTDLTINGPSFTSQTIQACDSYTINGNVYTTGGLKIDTLVGQAANGCDSIVSTTLDLGFTTTSTIDTTLAEGATITIGGTEYDVSGSYTETIEKMDGCDSVITWNVTIPGSNPGAINENISNFVNVFPNPAKDLISIELTNTPEKIQSIRIIDIQGREIYAENNITLKSKNINLKDYENGVYFVEVKLANNEKQIVKVVKMK